MARMFPELTNALKAFIQKQQMFFVATATADGRVNLSPKGLDTLVVVDSKRILWLNLTGSGNETAAHLQMNHRMTLMWCSFDEKPLILRAYGTAKAIHVDDKEWDELYKYFPNIPGARQVLDMSISSVQTSCGYAVPQYSFDRQRSRLVDWADKKGKEGLREYWEEKNTHSIDGKPTGININRDEDTSR